jgi:hypothetical protein
VEEDDEPGRKAVEDDPDGPETEPGRAEIAVRNDAARRRRERERRRRRKRRKDEDDSDPVGDALDAAEVVGETGSALSRVPGCGRGSGRGGRGDGDGCGPGGGSGSGRGGGCDRDGPCDFMLLRISTMLVVAAVLVPDRPTGARLVRALIGGYQRRLTRFTPACPSTPNCSAYAHGAVDALGVRLGLRAAADRIRGCGRT